MQLRERLFQARDAINALVTAHGATGLRVFGSVARGEDTDSSDIDFLVSVRPGATLLDLARLEIDLEELLGRPVDVVTEPGLRESIRSVVLREAISV